jgi:Zn-dependent metalloprotease
MVQSLNPTFGTGSSSDEMTDSATLYFALQVATEYFRVEHNRNGWNGQGGLTYGRSHYSTGYRNAYWSQSCNCFTTGDGMVTLDIVGHELTHGLIQSEGGLTYSGESGGLNEAYADIFGTMIEFYGQQFKGAPAANYLLGERCPLGALRNMAAPIAPSVGAYYVGVGGLDVHYSSGIANKAFYLLAEGGSTGVCGYTQPIGRSKAADIFYHALVAYFTSSTNFAQARTHTINAAVSLYGNAGEAASVRLAWGNVKVGGCI